MRRRSTTTPGSRNIADAESLYRVLADEIVPCFYDRDGDTGLATAWIERMRQAMASLTPRFSAARMIRQYTEQHYLPGDGAAAAVDEPQLSSS